MKLSNIQKFIATILVIFLCGITAQGQTSTKESTQKASISAKSSSAETVKTEDGAVKADVQPQSKSAKDCDKVKSDKDCDKVKPSERDCKDAKKHSSKDCDKKKMTPSNKEGQEKKKSPDTTGDKK